MSNCELLKEIKRRILAGIPPEEAIPYDVSCANKEDFYEILYYAAQVLPDGRRKDGVIKKLEELDNVSRADISSE